MKTRIKSIALTILYIVLILYVVVGFVIPQYTMNIFGFRTFIVVSNSMEPTINVYDMIVITETDDNSLEVGDIITFEVYIPEANSNSFVTHYIGAIEENGQTIYKTRGAYADIDDYDEWTDEDGNPIDITFEQIEGKYRFKIPYVGYPIILLQDPIFVGLLIANGTIIYFIYKLSKKLINDKKTQQKKESS